MTKVLKPAPPQLEHGETLRASFGPDHATYWRGAAWLAAGAMAAGMAVLWLMGNPHIWTGAIGGLAAIAVRVLYLRSDEMGACWHLTDRRLISPAGLSIPLAQIEKVNVLGSMVQIVTRQGHKHLIKHQGARDDTRRRIEEASDI